MQLLHKLVLHQGGPTMSQVSPSLSLTAPVPVLTAREAAESPAKSNVRFTTEGSFVSGNYNTYKKQVKKKKTEQIYVRVLIVFLTVFRL